MISYNLFFFLHQGACPSAKTIGNPGESTRAHPKVIMRNEAKRDIALKIAWQYYGLWYTWGGDDPTGFDCSGFMIEILKSLGALPRKGDWTAAGLYHRFPIKPANGKAGDLVFWSNTKGGKIIHVEIMINEELAIGASGGGSRTKTRQDAIRHNAFIKVRPIDSRKYVFGFANPYV